MVNVLDGGGPKDSENSLNSFLTKCDNDMFWQIGADMYVFSKIVLIIWLIPPLSEGISEVQTTIVFL